MKERRFKNLRGELYKTDKTEKIREKSMLNYYSDYYKDEFYEKMLKIYLSGRLPCGRTGSLKNGMFLVY